MSFQSQVEFFTSAFHELDTELFHLEKTLKVIESNALRQHSLPSVL